MIFVTQTSIETFRKERRHIITITLLHVKLPSLWPPLITPCYFSNFCNLPCNSSIIHIFQCKADAAFLIIGLKSSENIYGKALPEAFFLVHSGIVTIDNDSLNLKIYQKQNTFGLDGREVKFYVYIQSTTMERPDLERTMEQVLPHGKSIAGKQDKLFKLVLVS